MKKLIFISILVATSLFAVDYSSMSIDELSSLRGTVPVEDRAAFRSAMQSKIQALPAQERSDYIGSRGKGQGQMLQDGSGSGGTYKGSMSGGSGKGKGRQ